MGTKLVTLSSGKVAEIQVDDDSPGWNRFVENETRVLKAISSELKYKSASALVPGWVGWSGLSKVSVDELLRTFNDALTIRGWSVDIAPAINADDRRGFIITLLEPVKNVKDKER